MTLRFDSAAPSSSSRVTSHAYPIEQLARSTETRFQMGFARMTMHLLPNFKEVALEPSTHGLRILASNESALVRPVEVIRQIHAQVEFGEPQVRLLYGRVVEEPVMWVRAATERALSGAKTFSATP